MSILLEALRKTEKDQRKVEAPNIHSEENRGPVSDSLGMGPLAALLVVALFTSGWFVWHQYQKPAGGYQPPVTLAPDRTKVASTPVVKLEAGKVTHSNSTLTSTTDSGDVGSQRTPVESFQLAAKSDSRLQTDAGGKVERPDMNTAKPADKTQPVAKTTAPDNNKLPVPESQTLSQPTAAAKKEFHPQEPEPINYWELPDAIRTKVPETRFSVLVYASKPADRFVLVNGQRLREGDWAAPGLQVKEIRREGVVFKFRLYQFLVDK